ncbi:MAG TPA: tetratricopeptide repeat protein [Mucilaginibacter sp.]|jgi:tetratricopeptide (TPR) repeat protein
MLNKTIGTDLKPIIKEARKLAIDWKHGFINYDHFFVAMLKNECLASSYLEHFDAGKWEEKVKGFYPADSKKTIKDSVPLTIKAGRVLRHSFTIARFNKEKKINTIHTLIAILSFENAVTQAFNEAGILIEDITKSYYKKEIKRFPPTIKPIRDKMFAAIEKFFISARWKNKKITDLINNATDLYLYQQYKDSATICSVGLSLSPVNFELKSLLAYNYVKLRDYESSLTLLEELTKIKPEDATVRLWLSHVYDVMGNYDAAANILDQLLMEQPNNHTFLNNRGFNLFRQERYLESVAYFEKALQQNPSFAYPLNNLGFAKYKLGEMEKGLSLIDQSLDLDKGNAFAWKNKGIIYKDQGNKKEALKNFNLALKYGYKEKYGNEVTLLMEEIDK